MVRTPIEIRKGLSAGVKGRSVPRAKAWKNAREGVLHQTSVEVLVDCGFFVRGNKGKVIVIYNNLFHGINHADGVMD